MSGLNSVVAYFPAPQPRQLLFLQPVLYASAYLPLPRASALPRLCLLQLHLRSQDFLFQYCPDLF